MRKSDMTRVALGTLCLLTVLAADGARAAQLSQYVIELGDQDPVASEVVDMDLDGNPDIVLVGLTSSSVVVRHGTARGTFARSTITSLGSGRFPRDLVVGRIDQDPWPDVAVVESGSDTVTILLGGPAGLSLAGSYPVGGFPRSAVLADLDGDEVADLVVGNTISDDLTILLGAGDGSFAVQPPVAAGDAPLDLAAADLNGDGNLDLIVANAASDDVSFLPGLGDGSFGAQVRFNAGDGPAAVVVGDFDCDNLADLAVAASLSDTVSVLRGLGDGSFEPFVSYDAGDNPQALTTWDRDGDGVQDLAIANPSSTTISLLPNNGDGSFGPDITYYLGYLATESLTAADLDGNGWEDLIATGTSSSRVSLLLNEFQSIQLGLPTHYSTSQWPHALGVGDFDEDGRQDIVATVTTGLELLPGNGDGTFDGAIAFGGGDPWQLAVGDLNQDDDLDVVVTEFSPLDAVTVYLGNGNGTFASLPGSFPTGTQPSGVVLGDFDDDGLPDIATANSYSDDVSVLLGAGDGTFQAQSPYPVGEFPVELGVGDFDEDGAVDIAVACRTSFAVAVLFGNGDGSFQPEQRFDAGRFPEHLLIADIDLDGHQDIIVDGSTVEQPHLGQISVLRGDGSGSFDPFVQYPAGNDTRTLAIGNFDGDGLADVIAGNWPCRLSWLLGGGDAGFTQPGVRLGGCRITGSLAEDFDGDGIDELAVSFQDPVGVGIHFVENRGPTADAGGETQAACTSPDGASLQLDGSASSDPDSSPGTDDDIVDYTWYAGLGEPCALLGSQQTVEVQLPVGTHAIDLRVEDGGDQFDADRIHVTVTDSTPPTVSLDDISTTTLWPPSHQLVDVQVAVGALDDCSTPTPVLLSIVSSEPDDLPGTEDGSTSDDVQDAELGTPDFEFRLRAERSSAGPGRIYTITYGAVDLGGNQETVSVDVSVPPLLNGSSDPLRILAAQTPSGTVISWDPVPGAMHYDVIRGTLATVSESETAIELGPVVCVVAQSTATSSAGFEDTELPNAGQGFFYLAQFNDGIVDSTFGTESVPKPRAPGPGTCP